MTKRAMVLGAAAILTLAACGGDDGPGGESEQRAKDAAAEIWLGIISRGDQERACELYHDNGNVIGDEDYEDYGVTNGELVDALRAYAEKVC